MQIVHANVEKVMISVNFRLNHRVGSLKSVGTPLVLEEGVGYNKVEGEDHHVEELAHHILCEVDRVLALDRVEVIAEPPQHWVPPLSICCRNGKNDMIVFKNPTQQALCRMVHVLANWVR